MPEDAVKAAARFGEDSALVTSSMAHPLPEADHGAPLAVSLALNRKLPVADQVYEALKKAIIRLQLMPGASISENRICRTFGVSRTPVRSAIARLSRGGADRRLPAAGQLRRADPPVADHRQPVHPQGAGGRDPDGGREGLDAGDEHRGPRHRREPGRLDRRAATTTSSSPRTSASTTPSPASPTARACG